MCDNDNSLTYADLAELEPVVLAHELDDLKAGLLNEVYHENFVASKLQHYTNCSMREAQKTINEWEQEALAIPKTATGVYAYSSEEFEKALLNNESATEKGITYLLIGIVLASVIGLIVSFAQRAF